MADDQTTNDQTDVAEEVKEAAEEVKEAAEEVVEAAEAVTEAKSDKAEEKAEEKAEAAEEKAEEAVEKAEEVAESNSAEASLDKEKPAEPAKEEKKPEPSGKFKNIIKDIESLSALELSELVKALEERFGVSAATPVAVAGAAPAVGAAEGGDEEKANYNVILKDGGANKIGAIKAIREVLPELGLVEAKTLVESAPKPIKENVAKEDAGKMKEKLEAAGASVELQ